MKKMTTRTGEWIRNWVANIGAGNFGLRLLAAVVFFMDAGCQKKDSACFSLPYETRSFFMRSDDGNLVPMIKSNGNFFCEGENCLVQTNCFLSEQTALVVMDPWKDCGSAKLNEIFGRVYVDSLLPLVRLMLRRNVCVIALTNGDSGMGYGECMFDEIEQLVGSGKVLKLTHDDVNVQSFAQFLKSRKIKNLIYCGFASNMCVIARPTGIIPMHVFGFRCWFVPEASAAVEFGDSWGGGGYIKV